MPHDDLAQKLLTEAQRYDPAAHTRNLLAPFRETLLLQRAKFMSYEQIAGTFARHGIKVSPAAVGLFCRRNFSRAEIERVRRENVSRPPEPATPRPAAPRPSEIRGPAIARDDI